MEAKLKVPLSGKNPTTPYGPTPTDEQRPDGQKTDHWVLPETERAEGFVRPVRTSYVHVGPPGPASLRDLTDAEHQSYDKYGYLKFEAYGPEKLPVTGKFWTAETLGRLGKGCGTVTSMPLHIAETYARDPGYYGSTFCCGCGEYLPVGEDGEFTWNDNSGERVGQ